jgi:hypothetical protein
MKKRNIVRFVGKYSCIYSFWAVIIIYNRFVALTLQTYLILPALNLKASSHHSCFILRMHNLSHGVPNGVKDVFPSLPSNTTHLTSLESKSCNNQSHPPNARMKSLVPMPSWFPGIDLNPRSSILEVHGVRQSTLINEV